MTETSKNSTTPKKPRATAAKTKVAPAETVAKTAAPKKKTTKSNVTQMTASREEIARLAHRFWAERGHQHGHHEEDWFRAEQELRGKAS